MSSTEVLLKDTSEQTLETAYIGMQDGISRLIRLSRSIKRFHENKTNAVADRFDPKDRDGNSQLTDFTSYADWVLRRHPQMALKNDVLHGRLQRTMLKRWRRCSYHQSKVTTRANDIEPKRATKIPKTMRPPHLQQSQVGKASSTSTQIASQPVPVITAEPVALSELPPSSHGMTVDSKFKPQEDAQSTVSKLRLKSLAGTRASEFPEQPKVSVGAQEFLCPNCGTLQPISVLEDKAWRLHVSHDLAPYVCIHEVCDTSEVLYKSTKEWLSHLETHKKDVWVCRRCTSDFHGKEAFKTHITTLHESKMSAAELDLLLELSTSPISLDRCPLCEVSRDEVDDLNNHIAEHLRQLSLTCLPWDVELKGQSNVPKDRAASGGADSSRIRMDESLAASRKSIVGSELGADVYAKDSLEKYDLQGRELPSGWERRMDLQGEAYYVDLDSGQRSIKSPMRSEEQLAPDLAVLATTGDGCKGSLDTIRRVYADCTRQLEQDVYVMQWLNACQSDDELMPDDSVSVKVARRSTEESLMQPGRESPVHSTSSVSTFLTPRRFMRPGRAETRRSTPHSRAASMSIRERSEEDDDDDEVFSVSKRDSLELHHDRLDEQRENMAKQGLNTSSEEMGARQGSATAASKGRGINASLRRFGEWATGRTSSRPGPSSNKLHQ